MAATKLSTNTLTIGDIDQILGRGLAVRAVVTHAGPAGFEFGERVAGDHPVELSVPEGTHRSRSRPHEQLRADGRAVDDGGKCDRCFRSNQTGQRFVHAHQSSSSMNRRTVPPQVSPTAKASSSLYPNVMMPGSRSP